MVSEEHLSKTQVKSKDRFAVFWIEKKEENKCQTDYQYVECYNTCNDKLQGTT